MLFLQSLFYKLFLLPDKYALFKKKWAKEIILLVLAHLNNVFIHFPSQNIGGLFFAHKIKVENS